MSSFKRHRSRNDQDDSSTPSPTPSPIMKAARMSATPPPLTAGGPSTSSGQILCTLPPTCNPPNRPTPLAGTRELESHYAMYHAHVCEEQGCGCVFPDARLLELHQTECHDPLAAVRKERGEKIFACHLPSCPRRFSTPKTRRLHLIEAHGFPKEYFFAVTNKGVGGLLKRWGEGASLLRRPWHARENGEEAEDDITEETETEQANGSHANGATGHAENADDDDEDDEQILFEKMPVDRPRAVGGSHGAPGQPTTSSARSKGKARQNTEDVDALANNMDTLSLVPSSIQFGRGAKRGALQSPRGRGSQGHVRRGSAGRGAQGDRAAEAAAPMEVDRRAPQNARGRGRGRGGGRGVPPTPRGGGARGVARGRGGYGGQRGAMLGQVGRSGGMGRGRGVSKGHTRS
ncbi:hypothetical protein BD413DRAFT_540273 [Trametes elegans]|nr:hypothetical protein BD413DRAFT_540273 [Trametes elegans]